MITPAEMPDEILNIQSGGSVDMSKIDYIGFVVKSIRSEQPYIQLCKVEIVDENDNIIPFSNNKTCGVWGGQPITSNTEGVTKIWDNLPVSEHYKTIISKTSYQNFYLFFCRFSESQNFSNAYKWKWYTAEDEPTRDPISFGLIMANGNEQNGLLKMIDYVVNNNTPTTRNISAYEGIIG